MRRFKNLVLAIVSATFVTVGLYSCGNDEVNNSEQQNAQNENVQSKPVRTSDEGYVYAQGFYSSDISLGRSIDLVDPDTNEGVSVTEVTVYGDSRARGYIVNKVENYDFLYFVDVNRTTNILTSFEAATSETKIFNNIAESPQYLPTDKFDFIEFSEEAMNTTYAESSCGWWRRLLGQCWKDEERPISGGGPNGEGGGCMTYRVYTNYFFGSPSPGGQEPISGIHPCN